MLLQRLEAVLFGVIEVVVPLVRHVLRHHFGVDQQCCNDVPYVIT